MSIAGPGRADGLRVATFNTELSRKGPGLLLRDILKGDPQVEAVVRVIAAVAPDIVLLQGIDHDHEGAALAALSDRLKRAGAGFAFGFSAPPNSGRRTGLDMDGDGRPGTPRDAQGYGHFTGQGGMALLSRYPIDDEGLRSFTEMLWKDLPGATLPMVDGQPFPGAAAVSIQRLSSVAHWDVPVITPTGRLHLLAFHATPPVFDGPEDRNGLRNRDELRLWQLYLQGALGMDPPKNLVLLGDANIDPQDGEGRRDVIRALLRDPALIDPRPSSLGGRSAADARHRGDPGLDTVAFEGPGALRVDYVLPGSHLTVTGAGVFWPAPGDPLAAVAQQASRHRLVWVDLALP